MANDKWEHLGELIETAVFEFLYVTSVGNNDVSSTRIAAGYLASLLLDGYAAIQQSRSTWSFHQCVDAHMALVLTMVGASYRKYKPDSQDFAQHEALTVDLMNGALSETGLPTRVKIDWNNHGFEITD